jgi:periplasmic divalent cation tolerance protein
MRAPDKYIAIFITCADKKEAEKIASGLIDAKLAACVNIISGVESLFWWKNKADRADEVLLIIKSKRTKFAGIIKKTKSLHSYSTPEIIALPVIGGNKDYLKWISDSLAS